MFGKKDQQPDPTGWLLRHEGKDYPADSFDVIRSWFLQNHIPTGSQIFDPDVKSWVKPEVLIPRVVAPIVATTTMAIDGRTVQEYVSIESVEIVIGTGPFSEFGGDIADFFGRRSTAFEQKLQVAKDMALQKLRFIAAQKAADAVIGIDLDYTEFSGNRIGVVANGTLVRLAGETRGV